MGLAHGLGVVTMRCQKVQVAATLVSTVSLLIAVGKAHYPGASSYNSALYL